MDCIPLKGLSLAQFTAQFLSPADEGKWRSLEARAAVPMALQWDYISAASSGVGKPVRVGVFTPGNQLLAGVHFVERKGRVLSGWRHAAPAPSGGVLHDPKERTESFLRDVFTSIALLARQHTAHAEIILPPSIQDARGLVWQGWTVAPHYNYYSLIDSEDALADQCESAVRRQARKAEESELRFVEGAELLPKVLSLWEETRRRQGAPDWVHEDAYHALMKWMPATEGLSVKVGLVEDGGGRPLAGGIFGADRERVYYLLGASGDEEGKTGAPTILHFHVTRSFFRERGAFVYDWVGANTPSIAQFKKKFRPTLEMCLRASWRKGIAGRLA